VRDQALSDVSFMLAADWRVLCVLGVTRFKPQASMDKQLLQRHNTVLNLSHLAADAHGC
jgi:hypothetical protein